MNKLIHILFASVFLFEYLSEKIILLPQKASFALDLIPVIVTLYIFLKFASSKKMVFPIKYLIVIVVLILVIIIGLLLNGTTPLRIVVGMRYYFKQLPLFFLPMVYLFTEKEVINQTKLLFLFLCLQTPVALYQRLISYSGVNTGDVITGTTGSSTTLTIVILFGLTFLFSLYLNKRVSLLKFILFSLLVFIPATINETKITLVLLPFLLISASYFNSWNRLSDKIKKLAAAVMIAIVALSIFVPIYDHFMKERTETGVLEFFFQEEDELERYLYYGNRGQVEHQRIRRGDAIVLSITKQENDIGKLIFGCGMANVLSSNIGNLSFKEKKRLEYGPGMLLFTNLVWELGFFGLAVHYIFLIMVFSDAMKLRKIDSYFGVIGLSWCTITIMMIIFSIYTNYILISLINYLFWYFSGIVVSNSYRISEIN